ncbi:MAG TPA: hypothetical protein DCE41_33495 [Cytophagales bacterium]|nr:hypothetical protein [Cytophagales bacterium]HAA20156.1 hypothetical protein [Cytophagales bacterium]HAP64325.1 hypothetical protein [Cytophagales bacterium]
MALHSMEFEGGKTLSVPKGTLLLREGEVENAFFHVLQGCLKSYVVDRTGKAHILQFAPEDWFISDMDSLYHEKPSRMYIEAVEDSQVIAYPKQQFVMEELNRDQLLAFSTKMRNSLIAMNDRMMAMLSATAEDRYQEFLRKYPTLGQRLPLKLIASYIGVTPEYLSEIRRKLARK